MSDHKIHTAVASRAPAAADEFREISYYAWRRGFASPRAAPAQTGPAYAPPAKSKRLFQF